VVLEAHVEVLVEVWGTLVVELVVSEVVTEAVAVVPDRALGRLIQLVGRSV
jgi:hypothetical protein